MNEQVPFGESISFAENPDPRCPSVLLLDTSGSMGGAPISQLNEGLRSYASQLKSDSLASRRVEVAIVTFGGSVNIVQEFVTADLFNPPELKVSGDTPMGQGISQALALLTARKAVYVSNGIQYYRPWIFMITDGAPTDAWQSAAEQVKSGEAQKGLSFFAVGVQGANFNILSQISVKAPVMLDGLKFNELFVWLSASQKRVSQSKVGDSVSLPAPTGWAST